MGVDWLTISICQCEFFGNNPMYCMSIYPHGYSIFNYLKLKKMKNKIDQYYISVSSRTNLLFIISIHRGHNLIQLATNIDIYLISKTPRLLFYSKYTIMP